MDAPPGPRTPPEARRRVTALYEAHAPGLVKLAKIMLGDQSQAEDVVQDAFLGLYRQWPTLRDQDRALGYLRASVLNGCRAAHRGRTRRARALLFFQKADDIASAEESALRNGDEFESRVCDGADGNARDRRVLCRDRQACGRLVSLYRAVHQIRGRRAGLGRAREHGGRHGDHGDRRCAG